MRLQRQSTTFRQMARGVMSGEREKAQVTGCTGEGAAGNTRGVGGREISEFKSSWAPRWGRGGTTTRLKLPGRAFQNKL